MLYTCNQKDTIGIKKVGGRKKNKQTNKKKKEKNGKTREYVRDIYTDVCIPLCLSSVYDSYFAPCSR